MTWVWSASKDDFKHSQNVVQVPVNVPVVLWYEVNIVEDETSPVVLLHCLDEADVEEHGFIEGIWVCLVDQEYSVVQILSPVTTIVNLRL